MTDFSMTLEFPEAVIGSNVGYISARLTGEWADDEHNPEWNTLQVEILECELGVDQLFAVPLDEATERAIEQAILNWLETSHEFDEALREETDFVSGSITVMLPGEQAKAA